MDQNHNHKKEITPLGHQRLTFLACTSDAFGDVVMTVASDPVVVTVVVGENMGGVSFNSFPVKLLNISPPAAPTPAPPPMVLLVLLMLLMLLLPLLLLLPLPLCVLVLGVSYGRWMP